MSCWRWRVGLEGRAVDGGGMDRCEGEISRVKGGRKREGLKRREDQRKDGATLRHEGRAEGKSRRHHITGGDDVGDAKPFRDTGDARDDTMASSVDDSPLRAF